MWGLIIQAILGVLKLFGLGTSKEPTAADLAARDATAETKLDQEETAHAVTDQAAAARAAADVAVMRDVAESGPAVDPVVNDKLAEQNAKLFRD